MKKLLIFSLLCCIFSFTCDKEPDRICECMVTKDSIVSTEQEMMHGGDSQNVTDRCAAKNDTLISTATSESIVISDCTLK